MNLINFLRVCDKGIICLIADFLDTLTLRSWLWTALILRRPNKRFSPGKIWIDKYPAVCSLYAYKNLHSGMINWIQPQLFKKAAVKGICKSGDFAAAAEFLAEIGELTDQMRFWVYYTGDEDLIEQFTTFYENSTLDEGEFDLALSAFCLGGHLHFVEAFAIIRKKAIKYAFKGKNESVILHCVKNYAGPVNVGKYLKYIVKCPRLVSLVLTPTPLIYWHKEYTVTREHLEDAREAARQKNQITTVKILNKHLKPGKCVLF